MEIGYHYTTILNPIQYKTKEILLKGKDWIINEVKASGLRGRGGIARARSFIPSRRWIPVWIEMVLHEQTPWPRARSTSALPSH